jgi:hypothetical protein
MQTFAQALIELVLSGVVEREVAASAATNRHDFLIALDRAAKREAIGADWRVSDAIEDVDAPAPLRVVVARDAE